MEVKMDIISLPVEYDHKKIDGKFRLVTIASQRAKELSLGAKPKISTRAKKVTSVAIEETISGVLEFVTGEAAVIAREKAGKFDYRKQLEESKKIAAGEDLSELEKDLKVYLHEKGSYDKKAFEELFTDKKPEDAGEAEG
ncbi:MAG: DNA-directed RNA polymerase subunit omega [Nitrospira bacterium HGW-Nitrospira-1]|nr:MAG: DNA-directed RNA polymerase subunit omega [Nitrospira bacterium HGW-Nitrospira-1]